MFSSSRFSRGLAALKCWDTVFTTRFISTSRLGQAGFQGMKGSSMPAEMLQSQMERKKRAIARLENQALELKPVKDFSIRYSWKASERRRSAAILTPEEMEWRILLQKEWNNFVNKRKTEEDQRLLQLQQSQEKALYELRQESEELYQAALEVDEDLFPFTIEGPSETPPVKTYLAPLGSTLQWEESLD